MYNLKEILIGYRLEYQKIKKELDELENNIKILDESIKKCIPLLSNNQELALYFIDGKRNIMDTMISIKLDSEFLLYNLQNLDWNKSINVVYHFKNNERQYHILIEYIKKFRNIVKNILNSEYSKYIKGEFNGVNNELLTLDYNTLYTSYLDKQLIYYPKPDTYIINSPESDKEKELNILLSAKFSKDQFNNYQQRIIESNKDKKLILNK